MLRTLTIGAVFALSSPLLAQAPGLLFENPAWWTANTPRTVRCVDLNNDGFVDMLVAGRRGQVAVHLNAGDGTMGAPTLIDVGNGNPSGTETEDLAVGDLNGDAFPDFAVANVFSENLQTFINDGAGNFTLRDTIPSPNADGFTGVAIGDPNEDGLGDIVGVQGGPNFLQFYVAEAGGGFGPNIPAFLPNSPANARFGDADGDGLLDMLVIAANGPNPTGAPGFVATFLNGGFDGETGEWLNYNTFAVFSPTAQPAPSDHELADMNGDGALDVVVSTSRFFEDRGFVEVLLNTGNGTFTPAASAEISATANGLDVGDLNGDGLPDIVCANANDQDEVTVILQTAVNRGVVELGDVTAFEGANDIAIDAALGDLDGDGDLDFVVGCIGGQSVNALLNDGDGRFALSDSYALDNPQVTRVHALDIDGDGDEDLLTITDIFNVTLSLTISINDGDGSFTPGPPLSILPDRVGKSLAADFTGDGRTDVLTYSFDAGTMRLLTNNGDGTVTVGDAFTAPGQAFVFGFCALDADEDGDTDLFTTGSASNSLNTNKLFVNDGAGGFTVQDQFLFESYSVDPFPIDLDADGDLDLVALNAFRDLVLLRNNGDNTFGVAGSGDNPDNASSGVVADDFNNDGAPDIAVHNTTGLRVALFLGSGTPFVLDPATLIPVGPGANEPGLADIDGDGDMDLLLNITQGNGLDVSQMYALGVMLNNGDGTFGALTGYHCRGRPSGRALADFNDDGLLDAAVGVSTFDESFFVFLQRGEGESVCLGDCDSSGTVDFNDLVSMLFEFGTPGSVAGCDADQSGTVDFNDLVSALFVFGPCP